MSDMDEIRQTRFSAGVQELFYLIDELPVGLVILDDVGTVVRASPLAVSHLGRQVEEVVGGDLFAELLPELRSHGVGEAYRRGILTGQLDDTRVPGSYNAIVQIAGVSPACGTRFVRRTWSGVAGPTWATTISTS